MIISISHIELAGSELRIVSEIDAFISELSSNLIDSLEATNHQLLQIQLRSYAHEHIEAEIVVVGDEWLGSGSSSDQVHHRRLYFQETLGIQEVADVVDYLRPDREDAGSFLVKNEIQVPLTISNFLVLQASMRFWKHVKTR